MGQYCYILLTLKSHIEGRNFGSPISQTLQVLMIQPFLKKPNSCQLKIYLLNYETLCVHLYWCYL